VGESVRGELGGDECDLFRDLVEDAALRQRLTGKTPLCSSSFGTTLTNAMMYSTGYEVC
jgi:hypothetical protein